MAVRTKEQDVKDVLGDNYGAKRDGSLPSVRIFIKGASIIVDQMLACASRKGRTVTTAEAEYIECLMAAHLYMMSDKAYASRSTVQASASFQGQTGMGFESTDYGQQAMRVDPSGCLANIDKRQVAGGAWLGKPPSEQIPYEDRD